MSHKIFFMYIQRDEHVLSNKQTQVYVAVYKIDEHHSSLHTARGLRGKKEKKLVALKEAHCVCHVI